MKFSFVALFINGILVITSSVAQNSNLLISVTDKSKEPLIGATVQCKNSADSLIHFNDITNELGQAIIQIPFGMYQVSISYVGMGPISKNVLINQINQKLYFQLQASIKNLAEVTVTAQRPLMRQEDDRTILDPEPIAKASTNAYEIMEKTPGLFLDQDGNVYLSSTSPATIYINGREQRMSASDIATALKSMPPNSIERLEIVRSPSAKYDASGSGGIVNVVLKKGVKLGRTGSINTGFNIGNYSNQFIGISLNDNNGSKTSYLNFTLFNRINFDQIETTRELYKDSFLIQRSFAKPVNKGGFLAFGFGNDFTDKWSYNLDTRISLNKTNTNSYNTNTLQSLNTNFSTNNNVVNRIGSPAISQSFNTKYKLDSIGSEWTADVSYNYNKNDLNQEYSIYAFGTSQSIPIFGKGDILNERHVVTGQLDLKKKFHSQITLETGLKWTSQFFNNSATYFIIKENIATLDQRRNSLYKYNDKIQAGYFQGSKTIGKFIIKGGIRYEGTRMNGHQQSPGDTTFKINRYDVFPFLFLSRALMKIASYDLRAFLIYRRSIARPSYEMLNPYIRYVDQFLNESGNPRLKPQFTQNIEANVSVGDRPIFAIGKNYIQDIFTQVVYRDQINETITNRTYDNLGKNTETYFRILGAIPPGGKYFFVAGTQFNMTDYSGFYQGQPLQFKRGTWSFFTFHQLKIGKETTLMANGFWRTKGQQQFYELSDFGSLSFTLNQNLLNNKMILTTSLSDVFYSNKNDFILDQGFIKANGARKSDTRRFGLNLRYNFGIKKREERNMFNVPDDGN